MAFLKNHELILKNLLHLLCLSLNSIFSHLLKETNSEAEIDKHVQCDRDEMYQII